MHFSLSIFFPIEAYAKSIPTEDIANFDENCNFS